MLSRVPLFATPWTVARQSPLFMGILQARILEWIAMLSSRGSSPPRRALACEQLTQKASDTQRTRASSILHASEHAAASSWNTQSWKHCTRLTPTCPLRLCSGDTLPRSCSEQPLATTTQVGEVSPLGSQGSQGSLLSPPPCTLCVCCA